jgi:hypothetical protein
MTMGAAWEIAISAGLGLLGILSGWALYLVSTLREDINKLRERDEALGGSIGIVRELIAGEYMKRGEFNAAMSQQTQGIYGRIEALAGEMRGQAELWRQVNLK